METDTLGRVTTEAKFENLGDIWEVQRGLKSPEEARSLVVSG